MLECSLVTQFGSAFERGEEGLKGQVPPPDAGGHTFFQTGDGPTTFRFNPRNADDIFAEFFGFSSPFGGGGGGGGNGMRGASSVIDDEVCGTRSPGVVARLMGLDSLPSSSFLDPYFTPYFDSQSLQDVLYWRTKFNHLHDHQILYSGKSIEKAEGSSRNFMEEKPQQTRSRPIEKFQTEVMPPKSAKSIPLTPKEAWDQAMEAWISVMDCPAEFAYEDHLTKFEVVYAP